MKPTETKTATCPCGGLRIMVRGRPLSVYLCCCRECQRATGAAFAYRARYARAQTIVEGEGRSWRRSSDAGRWLEHTFCPACGGTVFMGSEASPDSIAISVGCFEDGNFPPPRAAYWTARKQNWYAFSDAVSLQERQ